MALLTHVYQNNTVQHTSVDATADEDADKRKAATVNKWVSEVDKMVSIILAQSNANFKQRQGNSGPGTPQQIASPPSLSQSNLPAAASSSKQASQVNLVDSRRSSKQLDKSAEQL